MKTNVLIEEFYSPRGIGKRAKEVLIVMSKKMIPVPYGMKAIFREGHLWTVIDNETGDNFTESFLSKSQAKRYLRGNQIGGFYRGPIIVPRRLLV